MGLRWHILLRNFFRGTQKNGSPRGVRHDTPTWRDSGRVPAKLRCVSLYSVISLLDLFRERVLLESSGALDDITYEDHPHISLWQHGTAVSVKVAPQIHANTSKTTVTVWGANMPLLVLFEAGSKLDMKQLPHSCSLVEGHSNWEKSIFNGFGDLTLCTGEQRRATKTANFLRICMEWLAVGQFLWFEYFATSIGMWAMRVPSFSS